MTINKGYFKKDNVFGFEKGDPRGEEARREQSEAKKRYNPGAFKKGNKLSPEHIRKISEAKKRDNPGGFKKGHQVFSPFENGNQYWKQRKVTRGTFKKGHIKPQYVIQRIIQAHKGKKHAEETIRKMSERRYENPSGFCKQLAPITEEMMKAAAETCKSIPGLQRHGTS